MSDQNIDKLLAVMKADPTKAEAIIQLLSAPKPKRGQIRRYKITVQHELECQLCGSLFGMIYKAPYIQHSTSNREYVESVKYQHKVQTCDKCINVMSTWSITDVIKQAKNRIQLLHRGGE